MSGYPAGGPPPPPPPPPGGYYYEPPPPPPPPEDEGVRTHDGFYLRAGLGFGWGQVQSELEGFEATYSGSGWLWELLLGGTIGNTVVIGGGILAHEISDPDLEINSEEFNANGELDGGLGIAALGPFVDFFFGPESGGHIGSMIGVASIGLEDEDEQLSSGWGFSLFGGYDFWVSDQWALGVNGRYLYAKGEREFDNFDIEGSGTSFTVVDTAHTFGVLFSALYH